MKKYKELFITTLIIVGMLGYGFANAVTPPLPPVQGGSGTSTKPAKGSLLVGVTSTQYGVLGVGTDGQMIVASSTADYGVVWSSETDPVVKALTGIIKSNGSTISAITDNSSNWDTAYTDRLKWDGGATGLSTTTAKTSLGLADTAYIASSAFQPMISSSSNLAVGILEIGAIATSSPYSVFINQPSANNLQFNTAGDPAMGVYGIDKNVGIGTTTPSAKLHVIGSLIAGTSTFDSVTIGNATSSFLATDSTGKIIATTTPTGGSGGKWVNVENATRVSNTQFTATGFTTAFPISAGTYLTWTESGTVNRAMVSSVSLSAPTTTVNVIGDVIDSIDASSMRRSIEKVKTITLQVAGTIGATTTDAAGHYYAPYDLKLFGSYFNLGTAGNGTTTIDININGSTAFTTKPYINGTNTASGYFTADAGKTIASGDYVSLDIDSPASTAGVDLYAFLLVAPSSDPYLQ